jgi:HPr kinase/phosphorylase
MNRGAVPAASSRRPSASRPSEASPRKEAVISGGLLRIRGQGVLIVGTSGLGKSESALELISRGHQFISDDVVFVKKTAKGRLIGKAPSISRHFMEIRGLGIINIKEIFGPRSIASQSPIDLVIRLRRWPWQREYDRLGLQFPKDYAILEERVPQINIPISPGKNIATLIEVACEVLRLRKKGYHASREIVRKLHRAIARQSIAGERP